MGFDTVIWHTARAVSPGSVGDAANSLAENSASGGRIVLNDTSNDTSNDTLSPATCADPSGAIRVLLVDDHVDTLKTLRRLLENHGYVVIAVANVTEALDWADAAIAATDCHNGHNGKPSAPFDILVSDIGLPDGDGCELLTRLRDRFADVCAIALSGYGMEVDLRTSAKAGFAEHLVKPTGVQQLDATVRRVLATVRAARRVDIAVTSPH
jgi:CheY-like chemotaxis protein